jgi:hypothetical protein
MRRKVLFWAIAIGVIFISGQSYAASDTKDLTVNAAVSALAKLTLDRNTINFASADPDTTPNITADNTVAISAKRRATGDTTLTVLTGGDLVDGGNSIAIGNVTWAAVGGGYNGAGTLNKTTAQNVGTFTNSGTSDGTLTFTLANNWSYVPGSYTATATFTLTTP